MQITQFAFVPSALRPSICAASILTSAKRQTRVKVHALTNAQICLVSELARSSSRSQTIVILSKYNSNKIFNDDEILSIESCAFVKIKQKNWSAERSLAAAIFFQERTNVRVEPAFRCMQTLARRCRRDVALLARTRCSYSRRAHPNAPIRSEHAPLLSARARRPQDGRCFRLLARKPNAHLVSSFALRYHAISLVPHGNQFFRFIGAIRRAANL